MPGQPQLCTNDFFGLDARDLVVLDPAGGPSNLIIRRSDEFKLQVSLVFGGYLAPLILCCLCWRICYCLDVLCGDYPQPDQPPQPGQPVPPRPADRTFCSPLYCAYNDPIPPPRDLPPHTGVIVYDNGATEATVPANSLDVATYKLTAVARFYCRDEQHRAPYIAAFTDGPVIEITD
ncbi:MAG TPA: hypothetical protein VFA45_13185 [Actinomycetes bacterium]|jgi:hypothetical protein|nr:hypothetical protein [Actinomycetes bacterium]